MSRLAVWWVRLGIHPERIAPGHPERSVLLHRMSHRKEGAMPPLATSMVDREAVEILREWIRQLPKNKPK